jgi:hypothetical protein
MPETTYTQAEVAEIVGRIDEKLNHLTIAVQKMYTQVGKVNGKEWYSPAEFAQRVGLGYHSVMRRIREGHIKSEQLAGKGARIRIPHSELELMHGDRG